MMSAAHPCGAPWPAGSPVIQSLVRHHTAAERSASNRAFTAQRPRWASGEAGDDRYDLARPPTRADLPDLRPLDRVVNGATYRHARDARRPSQYGGGVCTLLVRRVNDHVELLFHASPETGAIMTDEQTIEIAQALTTATENRRAGSR